MKKIVLTLTCTLALAGVTYAQGTVNFATFIPTYISAKTNSTLYSPFFGGGVAADAGAVGVTTTTAGSFYYALLWTSAGASSPTTLTELGTWTDTGVYAVNATGIAGALSAGTGTAGTAITGLAAGTTGSFILVGWSANLGSSWSSVYTLLSNWDYSIANAYFGITAVGQVTPSGVNSPGVNLFGTAASGLIYSPNTQLYLLPVPEPSTIALAGLGGLAMLALRRRK